MQSIKNARLSFMQSIEQHGFHLSNHSKNTPSIHSFSKKKKKNGFHSCYQSKNHIFHSCNQSKKRRKKTCFSSTHSLKNTFLMPTSKYNCPKKEILSIVVFPAQQLNGRSPRLETFQPDFPARELFPGAWIKLLWKALVSFIRGYVKVASYTP